MRRIASLAMILALLAPATGLASRERNCQPTGHSACSPVKAIGTGNSSATDNTVSFVNDLPFSSVDAVLLVGGGSMLLLAGFAAELLSRRVS